MPKKSMRPESKSWVGIPKMTKPMNLGNGRKATKHVPPAPTSPKQRPRKSGGR